MKCKRSWLMLVLLLYELEAENCQAKQAHAPSIGFKLIQKSYVTRSIFRIRREIDFSKNVFRSRVQTAAATKHTLKIFHDVMRADGWLQKEGFISDKYVEASNKDKKVTFVKCFRSFVDMLHVIKRSQINHVLTKSELESMKKDGKGGLYVVVNFLLDPINLHNLITWLEKAVKEKIDDIPGNLMHCKARMIIEYGCCTTSPIKWLKPEYSEFRISVG